MCVFSQHKWINIEIWCYFFFLMKMQIVNHNIKNFENTVFIAVQSRRIHLSWEGSGDGTSSTRIFSLWNHSCSLIDSPYLIFFLFFVLLSSARTLSNTFVHYHNIQKTILCVVQVFVQRKSQIYVWSSSCGLFYPYFMVLGGGGSCAIGTPCFLSLRSC